MIGSNTLLTSRIEQQLLGALPGQQGLEDNLRDHWTSVPHRQERLRLIHRLLEFSLTKKCRVTVLSGDVHGGAAGKELNSDRDISCEIIEFPGTRHSFIGARNWLALEPDAAARFWANWHVENELYPFTKVIHPINFEMPPPIVLPQ